MKRLFASITLFILSAGLLAAGERIALADFKEIEIHHAFKVTLVPSDHCEIVFPDNLDWIGDLKVSEIYSVKDGTLELTFPKQFQSPRNKSQKEPIVIYFKSLKSLDLSGASSAKSEKAIQVSKFELELSGASRAQLELTAESLETQVSGASCVTLTGTAKTHEIKASGASHVKAEKLSVLTTDVHISGASHADISSKKATGKASGASHVNVTGAGISSISTSGASSVKHK